MIRAKIIGSGAFLPDNIVTNDDLAKRMDTSDEWIRERTGIRQRYIAKGTVDVVVTDGFTGNIALKTAEGTARLVGSYLRQALKRSLFSRLGAVIASGALQTLRRKLDPRTQNGGVFLGLNGIVVKAHGGADAVGFASAVDTAIDMARADINARISTDRSAIAAESAGAKVGEL